MQKRSQKTCSGDVPRIPAQQPINCASEAAMSSASAGDRTAAGTPMVNWRKGVSTPLGLPRKRGPLAYRTPGASQTDWLAEGEGFEPVRGSQVRNRLAAGGRWIPTSGSAMRTADSAALVMPADLPDFAVAAKLPLRSSPPRRSRFSAFAPIRVAPSRTRQRSYSV
jgi:hypothetical protein